MYVREDGIFGWSEYGKWQVMFSQVRDVRRFDAESRYLRPIVPRKWFDFVFSKILLSLLMRKARGSSPSFSATFMVTCQPPSTLLTVHFLYTRFHWIIAILVWSLYVWSQQYFQYSCLFEDTVNTSKWPFPIAVLPFLSAGFFSFTYQLVCCQVLDCEPQP